MSVVDFVIACNAEYEGVVKAKDPLVLHHEFWRFVVRSFISQNTRNGKGKKPQHRRYRLAPIRFGSLPMILTKDSEDVNFPILIATGTLMDVDHRRVVAKRIILTGHLFKLHKRFDL
ncbi:hypothetical protein BGZ65_000188 [Modicella reniformis]|uniref:Ribosome biogenesis protein BMS1/TSR1 C-terminal domain-containing protein n=1 Tax=Modicella reniformis TaxID=1440133 RepID=A0A9P6SNE1_9FUNG|nr:hypothetical protein BGZ65_000188 [Modicella reniformis]